VTEDDLVPLKRVLDEVGVSRATLWRALKSDIEGFPKPTIIRGRVHWRRKEVAAIDLALDAYGGRGAFDEKRRRDRIRPEERHKMLLELKKISRRRRRAQPRAGNGAQPDLFGW
jgi:predicted DNA-binding transcriptional regulator AlpA